MEFRIEKYKEIHNHIWNDFIKTSKNGTFLFDRNYMDYHCDRFIDHSLLVYKKDKLVAVFPANEVEKKIQSHGGLSYGGLVYTTKLRTISILDVFKKVINYYSQKGFEELYYKVVPKIYNTYPSAEDEYALFALNAKLYRKDVSSTIDIKNRPKLSKGRKWLLARSKKENIVIEESLDFHCFFDEYNIHLKSKYNVNSVHSPEEMLLLKDKFPNNIKLLTATKDNCFLGGTILYFTETVIHAQYIHFSKKGKDVGSFDLLMNYIFEKFKDYKYFDFGISTEKNGRYLNEGLISFKESFGARATVCDFYKISL